jgi:hypothetical protein
MIAARAVGKRGDATTDTVAAWKRTKAQAVEQKRKVSIKQTETPADRKVRYQASEDEQKLAIDVGSEIPEDMRGKPEAAQPRQQAKPKPQEEGDYTSRLLKAKRRAQQGGDQPKEDDKS